MLVVVVVVIVARDVLLPAAGRRMLRRFALVLGAVSGRWMSSFQIGLVGVDGAAVVAFRLWIVVVVDELLDGSEDVSVAPVQRRFECGPFGLREESGQSIQRHSLAGGFRLTSAATGRLQCRPVVVDIRQLELCPIGWHQQFRLVCS